ncbi:uncharacterized protein [Temnothorax nylanderi]|uniref:uncharacterized protein n=1 Tax=Temnothorax nylanderi TaxID=102681 RepID=UPI003A83FB8D
MWEEFRERQDALEDLNPEFENDGERESFKSDYYTASAAAKALIDAKRKHDPNPNQSLDVSNSNSRVNTGDNIKLPPIHLPTFKGSYEQWPNFRNTFKAVIDENESLSDIKKLYYLRSSLKGVASEIMTSIEMSADNYEIAWNLLENRFENKRVLVHHHLQALIEYPAIQKEQHASLRQLLDSTEKHVRALKKLGQPTEQWSAILVHLMTAKLDSTTKREWENKTSSRDVATYDQFIEFITNRCIMLETLQLDKSKANQPSTSSNDKSGSTNKRAVAAVATKSKSDLCLFCKKGEHKIHSCPSFLNLSPQVRIKEMKVLKVCPNCLREGHTLEACGFGTCRLCQKKHNSLLHINKNENMGSDDTNRSQIPPEPSSSSAEFQSSTLAHCATLTHERGLLATAIIKIQDSSGEYHECRAFLDPGSQTNFITQDLCDKLHLPQQSQQLSIRGIDNIQTIARKIDVLLGSVIFWELLCVGQVKLGRNHPIAQKTKLGWIIVGPIGIENPRSSSNVSVCAFSQSETLENQLERFWHVEEGAPYTEPCENDKICEEEFVRTHRRNAEGRFELRLPLKGNINQLGHSRETAVKCLKSMERKFAKSPALQEQYGKFMQEYQDLGHMTEVTDDDRCEVKAYTDDLVINYLPHHAVIKEDSRTT